MIRASWGLCSRDLELFKLSSLADQRETLAKHFANVVSFVERRDWRAARQHALEAAAAAEAMNDATGMLRAGEELERLNEFGIAGRLMAQGGRIIAHTTGTEWDGTDVRSGTLLIEQRIRDNGALIRNARLVGLAGRHANRCILLVAPRLVSLYSRSFPGLDVRAKGIDDEKVRGEADVVASFETLMQHLAPDAATLAANFLPLRPDAGLVLGFRERYRPPGSRLPVIGIAWASTNKAKDLPPLECWARFFRESPAHFISLQYGDVAADLAYFQASGAAPRSDPAVDSLRDLDTFAAQVAALDAVVTISNTAAHMAGALGIPTVVILDDKFHLIWPVSEDRTPWYPETLLVRKQGRDWAQTFVDVRSRLLTILPSSPA
jgi:hypothetical protein